MINLSNKIIIIFGSEGKIGSDLIKKISKFNCIIYACDNSFKKKLNVFNFNNAKKIEYKFDITKENNFHSLVRYTINKNHRVDAIVHCAYPKTNNWGVKIEDAEIASDTFTLFMGDEVEPRRNYIEEHAKDVEHLDV